MSKLNRPKWTVLYNIVSEDSSWIGTGWEFFNDEKAAQACYDYQIKLGNYPCKRPYSEVPDYQHLGVIHRM